MRLDVDLPISRATIEIVVCNDKIWKGVVGGVGLTGKNASEPRAYRATASDSIVSIIVR